MADFLTNLAGRTLGRMPVVKPMMASRFASEALPMPEPPLVWDASRENAAMPDDSREGKVPNPRHDFNRSEPLEMTKVIGVNQSGQELAANRSDGPSTLLKPSLNDSSLPRTTEAWPEQSRRAVTTKQSAPNRSNDFSRSSPPKTPSVVTTNDRSNDFSRSSPPKTPSVVTTNDRSNDFSRSSPPKMPSVVTTNDRSNDFSRSSPPKTPSVVTTNDRSNDVSRSAPPKTPEVVTTNQRQERLVPLNRREEGRRERAARTSEVVTTSESSQDGRRQRAARTPEVVTTQEGVEMSPKRLLVPRDESSQGERAGERAIALGGRAKLLYNEPVAVKKEAPTIRVTIGRIEVRAQQPVRANVPQRPTRTRPRPAVSLDDYLKQRAGGRR